MKDRLQQVARVEELRAELAAAEAELEAIRTAPSPALAHLAITLHRKQCHLSHDDRCAWDYERENGEAKWDAYTHKRYLEKAERLALIAPPGVVEQLLEVI